MHREEAKLSSWGGKEKRALAFRSDRRAPQLVFPPRLPQPLPPLPPLPLPGSPPLAWPTNLPQPTRPPRPPCPRSAPCWWPFPGPPMSLLSSTGVAVFTSVTCRFYCIVPVTWQVPQTIINHFFRKIQHVDVWQDNVTHGHINRSSCFTELIKEYESCMRVHTGEKLKTRAIPQLLTTVIEKLPMPTPSKSYLSRKPVHAI